VNFKVVIPARYASTRLPGKALLSIHNKPMVQHVYENACASGAEEVVIATDDQRIVEAANKFDAKVCMTSTQHTSGTDRIREVAKIYDWADDIAIVNLQGDEPQMPAQNITQVATNLLANKNISMSTLCAPIADDNEFYNPNVVKVFFDANNIALNFSRDITKLNCKNPNLDKKIIYRHLGIYAYTVGFLDQFTKLPPSSFEMKESLEQLRALQNGYKIFIELAGNPTGMGVDTQEDYEAILKAIV
jgi:3-deoxy-manno-octulosonate cytidylyltransferase (CMP-KDO synthetase)